VTVDATAVASAGSTVSHYKIGKKVNQRLFIETTGQLNETTGFKPTWDNNEVRASKQHMCQWNIEFRYASSIVWIFHFQLHQFLLHLHLSCALNSEVDSYIIATVIKLSVVVLP